MCIHSFIWAMPMSIFGATIFNSVNKRIWPDLFCIKIIISSKYQSTKGQRCIAVVCAILTSFVQGGKTGGEQPMHALIALTLPDRDRW